MMFEGTVFVSRLWAVVLYSGLAAACAALGVLPFMARRRLPSAWLGWADALAAGLMLGASYILVVEGIERLPLAETIGTLAGIATLYLVGLVPNDVHVFDDLQDQRESWAAAAAVLERGQVCGRDLQFGGHPLERQAAFGAELPEAGAERRHGSGSRRRRNST